MAYKETHARAFWFPIFRSRGVAILFFGLAFPVLGVFVNIPTRELLFIVVSYYLIFAFFLMLNYFQVRRAAKSISISYQAPSMLFSNEPSTLELTINSGRLDRGSKILFRPEVVSGIKLLDEVKSVVIRNEENYSLVFGILPFERGQKKWGNVYCRISSQLGLCYWQCDFRVEPSSSKVYPNFSLKNDNSARPFHLAQIGEFSINRLGGGREFDYLRNYIPGDDTRKIDWKHSAKAQKLIVKLFKPESHQVINIALDCSRRLSGTIDNRGMIEHAADAAARLVKFAGRYEDEVGFLAFNNQILRSCPARKGLAQQSRIVQALTEVKISAVEPDYQLLTEWALRKNRRSLLVLITCVSNPIAVDSIMKALLPVSRRHLLLLVSIADRELEVLVKEKAANLQDAYIISAASEQSSLIRTRLQELTRRGIETLSCDAINLKAELLKKYYRLKAQGRI